jgi:hypothetical protein
LLTGLMLVTGCAVHGLDFQSDGRVSFVTPKDRATLALPFKVQWTADVNLADDPGNNDRIRSFAVLVDRVPPPPGDTLASMFANDDSCRTTASCGDPKYLATRGIRVTTATDISVDQVYSDAREHRPQWHTVTIVFLDGAQRRVGESAFRLDFKLEDQ